jgi:hypothetical protein
MIAIRYRAWSSLRSPARDSRWRTTCPLEASSGAVPVWAAKACFGREPADVTYLAQELGGQYWPDAE